MDLKNKIGSVLVEFSLALPVFLAVSYASVELSLLITSKKQIDYAAEKALRTTAVLTSGCGTVASNLFAEELEKAGIKSTGGTTGSYTLEDAPAGASDPSWQFKYINLQVNITLDCFTCNILPGITSNFAQINKTYMQLLDEYWDPDAEVYRQDCYDEYLDCIDNGWSHEICW